MQQRRPFSSKLPDLRPPLKEAWRTVLPSESFIWASPQIKVDTVAVRCGHLMAALNILTGEPLWQVAVGREDIENKICISSDDSLITVTQAERESTLFMLSWLDGKEKLRIRIPGWVLDGCIVVSDNHIYVVSGKKHQSVYHIRQYDLQSRRLRNVISVPSGSSNMLLMDGYLILGSRSIDLDNAGLYVIQPNAKEIQRLLDSAVVSLQSGSQLIVAEVERGGKNYQIVAISIPDLTTLWSVDCAGVSVASNAGEIAHFETVEGEKRRVVLRDELSGTVLWRSDVLSHRGLYLFFSGDAVCAQDKKNVTVLNRVSGSFITRIQSAKWSFSWGGAVAPGRLVLGNFNEVVCYISID